jgi:broad specificity phosphatase PhoE
VTVHVDPELRETDRLATGFLPPAEFEGVADQFFANPGASVRGWESALDAQQRVVRAVGRALAATPTGDLALATHGAVGTLLWCRLAGRPIDRRCDQPGQGSWYAVDIATMTPRSGWVRIPMPGPDEAGPLAAPPGGQDSSSR